MSDPVFLQLHALTSYPGTLLNRDDAGFAKRMPFGGTFRTRISSQCLKYHWRNFDGKNSLYGIDVPKSRRSRETFKRLVYAPLVEEGYPVPLVRAATYLLKETILTGKVPTSGNVKSVLQDESESALSDALDTKQITVLGEPEIQYVRNLAKDMIDERREDLAAYWEIGSAPEKEDVDAAAEVLKFSNSDLKKNLVGLRLASGLDAAMFGRMVTSDILARGDAAVHVAHAFTTHEEESESDYFSAVDELRRDEPEESGELGAGHINSQELTSGLFYTYVVVDVPLLVSNIEGVNRKEWRGADASLASEVVKRLVHLVATVSPGAKLGSTAPHSYAQCLLAEAGSAQPRTLANAFQRAVFPNGSGILESTYDSLGRYVKSMDAMYGRLTERRIAAIDPTDALLTSLGVESAGSVPDIAEWSARQVGGGA